MILSNIEWFVCRILQYSTLNNASRLKFSTVLQVDGCAEDSVAPTHWSGVLPCMTVIWSVVDAGGAV